MLSHYCDAVNGRNLADCLGRHARGDWGDVGPDDWRANQIALREGERVFSTYTDRRNTRFYIITEADRSATTVLLPGDY